MISNRHAGVPSGEARRTPRAFATIPSVSAGSGTGWWIEGADGPSGPHEAETIRAWIAAGAVSEDRLVWREGAAAWRPAGEVPEIAGRAEAPAAFPACVAHAGEESIGLCSGCNRPACHRCLHLSGPLHLCEACLPKNERIRRAEGGRGEAGLVRLLRRARESPLAAAMALLVALSIPVSFRSYLMREPGADSPPEVRAASARRYYYQGARISRCAGLFREQGDEGRWREFLGWATEAYEGAARRHPQSDVAAAARLRLAEIFEAAGVPAAELEERYLAFLAADTASSTAAFFEVRLGRFAWMRGAKEEALERFRRAARMSFTDRTLLTTPQEAAEEGGEALLYEEAPRLDPSEIRSEAQYWIGRDHEARDRAQEAYWAYGEVSTGPLVTDAVRRRTMLEHRMYGRERYGR